MKDKLEILMGALMLLLVLTVSVYYNADIYYVQAAKGIEKDNGVHNQETEADKGEGYKVVIDVGHGGFDPGKIGINNELEKDINLAIALKLSKFLEARGITVVMTRTEDVDLGDAEASSKKKSDMQNRINIINEANADICVSIHQNSYSSEKVKGAQVFYYSASDQGKLLAATIQLSLKERIDGGNKRVEKSNDSYYILLKSQCPAVIVECGFLSNWEEATNLKDEYYQERIASAIGEGIVKYLGDIVH